MDDHTAAPPAWDSRAIITKLREGRAHSQRLNAQRRIDHFNNCSIRANNKIEVNSEHTVPEQPEPSEPFLIEIKPLRTFKRSVRFKEEAESRRRLDDKETLYQNLLEPKRTLKQIQQERGWPVTNNNPSTTPHDQPFVMASTKKYAGLPDLDDAGTELYQTPALTDDASTIQTSTIETESPTLSDDDNENFDRTRFNREEARRRFEPAVVNAKDVNFSYAVGGSQKSYTTRHRRRRRIRRSNGVEELGDLSDDDEDPIVESVSERLARLKRETEELRLEIEQKEKEDEEFQDSFEHPSGGDENGDHNADLTKGVSDLNRILQNLQPPARKKHETLEQEFSRRLDAEQIHTQAGNTTTKETLPPSTISAITAFSDRLTSIESVLGLSNITPTSNPTAILPTLETLTNQFELLTTIITPKPTNNTAPTLPPQMPHLDLLQSRLHTLHQSATSLSTARKAAQSALVDLETVRLRGIRQADRLSRYQVASNHRHNRPTSPTTNYNLEDDPPSRPPSALPRNVSVVDQARERTEISDELITPLFLEEQTEKIKALYSILPTIQGLQPLLPVVLERLRGLSVVHAGASEARNGMDEIESRVGEWEREMGRWKEAVEGVESGIEEVKGVMRENCQVVGELVSGVEGRVRKLEAES